jgi:thioredoxin reductase (NADPH)
VLVIGGGNSAGEESIFLTKFASKVTVVTRDSMLSASKVVVEKVQENPQIELIHNSAPAEFRGDGKLQTVVLKDTKTGELRELSADGVFVFIGLTPNTDIAKDQVKTDERGFIVTDMGMQTSMAGVFAAGDCREGSTKQAASAAGEGAAAALAIRRYIQPLTSGMPDHADMMERAQVA